MHDSTLLRGIARSSVARRFLAVFWTLALGLSASAQSSREVNVASRDAAATAGTPAPVNRTSGPLPGRPALTVALYFDALQGSSSGDLVRRALQFNGELAAARLEVGRARARLRQAGLRPNPTIDVGQTTGRLTGSAGESETSVGVTLPLELGGRRGRRVELARAELEAVEAEVAERARRLAGEVLSVYAESLSALRELEITEGLTELDVKTVVFVQARVNEGDTAPLELSLLQAEVERLRSRRALVEGRLRSSLVRLKTLAGIPPHETVKLREDINAPTLSQPPTSMEAAVDIALRTRPDLRLARLNEEVAQAGLRLARSLGSPEAAAFTRYTQSRSRFDETPVGVLNDRDKTLTFGVSVQLPVFNKNQGAKEEAALAISQARSRREFAEASVRAEVASAYARLEASRSALLIFEHGVISRSNDNIRTIRAAYEIGAFKITDLIAEQRRLLDSQKDFTEALTERYRALVDLQLAIGTPAQGSAAPEKE